MQIASHLRFLYHLTLKPIRGRDHAERLDSFYRGQADLYDASRARLLAGRAVLYSRIGVPDDGVWVDVGGGTAAALEHLGSRIERLRKLYVVDLSPSLIGLARERARARGWRNVETVVGDGATFQPDEPAVDVVTFSHSLTMMPDWFAALDHAAALLRPGGRLGAVDFYVARKHPAPGFASHPWLARAFWPLWFAGDNVHPSPDHLPYLARRFEPLWIAERHARVPYLPLRVPYYAFLGRTPAAGGPSSRLARGVEQPRPEVPGHPPRDLDHEDIRS